MDNFDGDYEGEHHEEYEGEGGEYEEKTAE